VEVRLLTEEGVSVTVGAVTTELTTAIATANHNNNNNNKLAGVRTVEEEEEEGKLLVLRIWGRMGGRLIRRTRGLMRLLVSGRQREVAVEAKVEGKEQVQQEAEEAGAEGEVEEEESPPRQQGNAKKLTPKDSERLNLLENTSPQKTGKLKEAERNINTVPRRKIVARRRTIRGGLWLIL
jgi:hypothetical protein